MPAFLARLDGSHDEEKEQHLKDRFHKFWMASVADAFQDDLQEIQKVRVLASSRLRPPHLLAGVKHDKVKIGYPD